MSLNRILVGVDGSEGSRRAVTFARDLAVAFKARLTLLHVIEPFPMGMLDAFEAPQSDQYAKQMRRASEFLNGLVDELALTDAEQAIEMGHPGDVICREATEREVDLIVVGWHGHRPGTRLLVGSVGAHVVAASNRSVTVVH
jgi:nucleotide-binding universal stress UspA family protein